MIIRPALKRRARKVKPYRKRLLATLVSHPSRSTPHSNRSVLSTAIDNQLSYMISGLRIPYSSSSIVTARDTKQYHEKKTLDQSSGRWRESPLRVVSKDLLRDLPHLCLTFITFTVLEFRVGEWVDCTEVSACLSTHRGLAFRHFRI